MTHLICSSNPMLILIPLLILGILGNRLVYSMLKKMIKNEWITYVILAVFNILLLRFLATIYTIMVMITADSFC